MEANITDEFLSSLQDFCEMNLVYLMDDGLQVSVVKHPVSSLDMDTTYLSCVTLRYPLAAGTFELLVQKDWNSVKDQIIPFFTRLNSEYNVITFDQLPMVTSSLFGQGINNTSQVQFGLRRRVLVNPALSNGGFRKNFTVDDVISDRLDLGNNLIVEIRFYVSCNDEVIVPVKRTIGSRVKRFLGFNESDFYVRLKGDDLQDELDDLCEPFLSPLADDGFTYEIRPSWNGEFDIRLSFTDGSTGGSMVNKLYDYSLVMDRFIPLVRMLSRRFELRELVYFYSTEQWDASKKVFTLEQIMNDEAPDFLVTTVKLTVKSRKQVKLQEGLSSGCPLDNDSDLDELLDVCEPFLAPLTDDGFTYGVKAAKYGGYPFVIVYVLREDSKVFSWEFIKDRVIPLFHKLGRDYIVDDRSHSNGKAVHFIDSSNRTLFSYHLGDLVFDNAAPTGLCKAVILKLWSKADYSGFGKRYPGDNFPQFRGRW